MVPAGASAAMVSCGQTITHNTTLRADLTDCPLNGLVIGADNVELNLNGHRIIGAPHSPLACFGGPPPGPCFGVDTNEHTGLTITNGEIADFDTDIGSVAPDGSTGDHITLLTLRQKPSEGFSAGVVVGAGGVVAFNHVDTSIGVTSSHVAGNVANFIGGRGDGSVIEHNRVARIDLSFATHSRVRANFLDGRGVDGAGITLEAHSTSAAVTNNFLLSAHISVVGSSDIVIEGNRIIDPPFPTNGISVGFDSTYGGVSSNDLLIGNDVYGASLDGINTGSAPHLLILRNHTSHNGQDGIANAESTATLTGNVANSNANFGIESALGVVDGGRNRARDNGNPVQCVNIACSP